MKIRFRSMWRRFKAGDETEAVADGVANLLIRRGTAALVEGGKHVDVPVSSEAHDIDESADSGDGTSDGTGDSQRSEKATVPVTVRHKPGHRTRKPDSSGS